MSLLYVTVLFLVLEAPLVLGQARIVGGNVCNATLYPSFVNILSSFLCGGTLLNSYWVLTAGHCVNLDLIATKSTVVRGAYNPVQKKIQVRYAVKGVTHPKFNLKKIESEFETRYDIGLIKVNSPFVQSAVLHFARLPPPHFTHNCTKATAFGTGSTIKLYYQRSLPSSMTLRCVELHLVDSEECRRTWNDSIIDDTVVCTMEIQGEKDACSGDSGGPLVCKGIIIGIISMGKGCALAGTAATYTKVESYLDFIRDTVKISTHGNPKAKTERSVNTVSSSVGCTIERYCFCFMGVWVLVVGQFLDV